MYKILSKFFIATALIISINGIAQVKTDNAKSGYEKAAKAYRLAASKTKCSDRRAVLITYAEWNEKMLKVLAGTLSSPGNQPTTAIPDCKDDLMGNNDESPSNQKDHISEYEKMQNKQAKTNDAIQVVGDNIWGIIQNGRASKEAATSQFVESFANDIFENRLQKQLNLKYYSSNTTCRKCNGTGVEYWDNSSPQLSGKSHICFGCVGTGKKFNLLVPFEKGVDSDPTKPELSELIKTLKVTGDNRTKTYQFILPNYRGIIELEILNFYKIFENNIIIKTRYSFSFKKKNQEFDVDASLVDMFDIERVIPNNSFQNIRISPLEEKNSNGNSFTSFKHYILETSNGEVIEFSTKDPNILNKVSSLIAALKK